MKKRKLCAILAAFTMVLTLLPTTPGIATVYAGDDTTSTTTTDGLVLNKTATLQDDGTYTINLEAYATGTVTSTTTVTTTTEVVPTDIILVLDQSGSMDYSMDVVTSYNYNSATPANSAITSGDYYYKADDGNYYEVTATKTEAGTRTETTTEQKKTGSTTTYKDASGKTYDLSELTHVSGTTYYVTNSGTKWNRQTRTEDIRYFGVKVGTRTYYYYSNGSTTSSESTDESDAKTNLTNSLTNYVVKFSSDNSTATAYTKVTATTTDTYEDVEVVNTINQYKYVYTYTDGNGKTVTIDTTSATGDESVVDAASASITLYTRTAGTTTSSTRLAVLKDTAQSFIDGIQANAKETDADHRIAVVGFAGPSSAEGFSYPSNTDDQQWYSVNSELFVGKTQYNYAAKGAGSTYNTTGNLAADHYKEAFQSVNTTTGYANLTASIGALGAKGGTQPEIGFIMANGIFEASDNTYTKKDGTTGTRNRVVVFLTDGEPGDHGFSDTSDNHDGGEWAATQTKNEVATTKGTYKASVYSVGIFGKNETVSDDEKKFLSDVSSNGTYTIATDDTILKNFFQTIESEITSTEKTTTSTVTLSSAAQLVDELSEDFVLPDDFETNINNYVTVKTAPCTDKDSAGKFTFGSASALTGADVAVRKSGDTAIGVTVKGFDFSSQSNWVKEDNGSYSGNELIVTITGVLAKDSAATGAAEYTNNTNSGIWDGEGTELKEVQEFNMPTTTIENKVFVLDYAKTAALDVNSATKVDAYENGTSSIIGNDVKTSLTGTYGNIATTGGLNYTPTTTNWDGYDTFYALGKKNSENVWAKVSVLPANNVYYEDTFTGTAGITYTGTWETVGTTGNQSATASTSDTTGNEAEQGWETSLSDDATYSDGSAHVSSTTGATAEFTFTGTGVDVYTRTNAKAGVVKAYLYSEADNNGSVEGDAANLIVSKSLKVDNESDSDEYYQIPTLSFTNLEHGTYKVVLKVMADSDGNNEYCIDGIRVYNPLSSTQESDTVVKKAYGEDELGASFLEVRDILLAANSENADDTLTSTNQVVFIDKIPGVGTSQSTSSVGTYEDYGPKNEVYLAQNQAIAFTVSSDVTSIAVGLKAPSGTATKVKINDADAIEISSASDLYYEITLGTDSRMVVIENVGSDDTKITDDLLSITKIKYTTSSGSSEILDTAQIDGYLSYANTMNSTKNDEYTDGSSSDSDSEDVDITNPTTVETFVRNLFSNIKKLFGRR